MARVVQGMTSSRFLYVQHWNWCSFLKRKKREISTNINQNPYNRVIHGNNYENWFSYLFRTYCANVELNFCNDVRGLIVLIFHKQVTASLMVDDSDATDCVQALHSAFFGNGIALEAQGAGNECAIPVNSPAAASSSGVNKRRADADHPETPPSVCPVQGAGTDPDVRPEETETQLSSDPATVGDDSFVDLDEIINAMIAEDRDLDMEWLDADKFFADIDFSGEVQPNEQQEITEAEESGIGLGSVTGEIEPCHVERQHSYRHFSSYSRPLDMYSENSVRTLHTNSLCSRLADHHATHHSVRNRLCSRLAARHFYIGLRLITTLAVLWLAACLTRFFARQTSIE